MLSNADWDPEESNKWELGEGLGILEAFAELALILQPLEEARSVVVGQAPGQTYQTGGGSVPVCLMFSAGVCSTFL